jgi:hypothetical protein
MFSKIAKSIMGAASGTVVLAAALASPAHAECRGYFCDIVKDVPVIGQAAQGGDAWIAGMKERGSSDDVLNHATGLNSWNYPVGRPAGPPRTVPQQGYNQSYDPSLDQTYDAPQGYYDAPQGYYNAPPQNYYPPVILPPPPGYYPQRMYSAPVMMRPPMMMPPPAMYRPAPPPMRPMAVGYPGGFRRY